MRAAVSCIVGLLALLQLRCQAANLRAPFDIASDSMDNEDFMPTIMAQQLPYANAANIAAESLPINPAWRVPNVDRGAYSLPHHHAAERLDVNPIPPQHRFANLESDSSLDPEAVLDAMQKAAGGFVDGASQHTDAIRDAARRRKGDIQQSLSASKEKINDALDETWDPAREQIEEAADDAGRRIGGVANRLGKRAAAGARQLADEAGVVAKKVGQKAVEVGKHILEHREEYAEKAKEVAKKGIEAAKEAAALAKEHKEELAAISKALKSKLDSASSGGKPNPSMTDQEYCTGCQIALSSVIEHTTSTSSIDDTIFVIHSACTDQPPVMKEACGALIRSDALAASQLGASRDAAFVCESLGLCYAGIADGSAAPA